MGNFASVSYPVFGTFTRIDSIFFNTGTTVHAAVSRRKAAKFVPCTSKEIFNPLLTQISSPISVTDTSSFIIIAQDTLSVSTRVITRTHVGSLAIITSVVRRTYTLPVIFTNVQSTTTSILARCMGKSAIFGEARISFLAMFAEIICRANATSVGSGLDAKTISVTGVGGCGTINSYFTESSGPLVVTGTLPISASISAAANSSVLARKGGISAIGFVFHESVFTSSTVVGSDSVGTTLAHGRPSGIEEASTSV